MATKKKVTTPKKSTNKAAEKPTLVELLARAGRFYGTALRGIQGFAETYVLAQELYGREARNEFRSKYPVYTDAFWSHIDKVGRHLLLPQFLYCSDNMISGILRLENSVEKQMTLIGATVDGKIETVSSEGKIILKNLADLSKIDEMGIVFAMSKATGPAEIRRYAYAYRQEWRKNKNDARRDDFERVGDLLRINHAIKSLSKVEWLRMGTMMGWSS